MRKNTGRSIFTIFVWLALYLSMLISVKNYTTIFIAFLTLGWHAFANVFCVIISSYRFKNPEAKYIEIKNKVIKKIFVRPFYVDRRDYFTNNRDNRINIIGFVLSLINTLMFVSFEILLFMPKIPCDKYIFTLVVGTRPSRRRYLDFELYSFNEIIPAEVSRAFVVVMVLMLLVFLVLFMRQREEGRRHKLRKATESPYKKPFKKTKWHHPLYTALIDISARKNNKKRKFWYETAQLNEIEDLVYSAHENAELKLERKGDKLISFKVVDVLNEHVVFTGLFI